MIITTSALWFHDGSPGEKALTYQVWLDQMFYGHGFTLAQSIFLKCESLLYIFTFLNMLSGKSRLLLLED